MLAAVQRLMETGGDDDMAESVIEDNESVVSRTETGESTGEGGGVRTLRVPAHLWEVADRMLKEAEQGRGALVEGGVGNRSHVPAGTQARGEGEPPRAFTTNPFAGSRNSLPFSQAGLREELGLPPVSPPAEKTSVRSAATASVASVAAGPAGGGASGGAAVGGGPGAGKGKGGGAGKGKGNAGANGWAGKGWGPQYVFHNAGKGGGRGGGIRWAGIPGCWNCHSMDHQARDCREAVREAKKVTSSAVSEKLGCNAFPGNKRPRPDDEEDPTGRRPGKPAVYHFYFN